MNKITLIRPNELPILDFLYECNKGHYFCTTIPKPDSCPICAELQTLREQVEKIEESMHEAMDMLKETNNG